MYKQVVRGFFVFLFFSCGKLDPGSGAAVPAETAPKLGWFIIYTLSKAGNGEIKPKAFTMETHAAVSLISGDHRRTEGPLLPVKLLH